MKKLGRLLFRIKRKAGKKILDVVLFARCMGRKISGRQVAHSKKAVWFDLHNNTYIRYLYNLAKWFESEGYQVYINSNIRFLLSLGDDYSRYLAREGRVIFTSAIPEGAVTFTDDMNNASIEKKISNDYLRLKPESDKGYYHVPIGMHPHMYKYGYWNMPYDDSCRKRSVFFAGNFDENDYKILQQNSRFSMPDRLEQLEALQSSPLCVFPQSREELLGNFSHGKVDIVDKRVFLIEQDELRQVIANYAFFIALPGVFMPLSHNIFEAMSVGTIPIVHEEYAALFAPQLKNRETAVIYNNDNFMEKIEEALGYTHEDVHRMVGNVKTYYKENLSPAAVVGNLLSDRFRMIFLNAGKLSVRKIMRTAAAPMLETV